MNAVEDAPLAPFDVMIVSGRGLLEGSAHEEALHLHGKKNLKDRGGGEVEMVG